MRRENDMLKWPHTDYIWENAMREIAEQRVIQEMERERIQERDALRQEICLLKAKCKQYEGEQNMRQSDSTEQRQKSTYSIFDLLACLRVQLKQQRELIEKLKQNIKELERE